MEALHWKFFNNAAIQQSKLSLEQFVIRQANLAGGGVDDMDMDVENAAFDSSTGVYTCSWTNGSTSHTFKFKLTNDWTQLPIRERCSLEDRIAAEEQSTSLLQRLGSYVSPTSCTALHFIIFQEVQSYKFYMPSMDGVFINMQPYWIATRLWCRFEPETLHSIVWVFDDERLYNKTVADIVYTCTVISIPEICLLVAQYQYGLLSSPSARDAN